MTSDTAAKSNLKVWECDDCTWVLAANKEEANKVYLEYMHDCHGPLIHDDLVTKPDEFFMLSLDVMKKYRYSPNEQNDDSRTYLVEYDHQIATDPTTPRIFAVGE